MSGILHWSCRSPGGLCRISRQNFDSESFNRDSIIPSRNRSTPLHPPYLPYSFTLVISRETKSHALEIFDDARERATLKTFRETAHNSRTRPEINASKREECERARGFIGEDDKLKQIKSVVLHYVTRLVYGAHGGYAWHAKPTWCAPLYGRAIIFPRDDRRIGYARPSESPSACPGATDEV